MKKAVIAIIVLLLLGGGGAGAYFYFGQKAEAAPGPMDEAAKADHAAKTEKAEEGAAVAQEEFVPIDAIVLPIIDESGVTQTVTLLVSIAAPDKGAAEEVKRLSPRLKDAFIQDMYGTLSRKTALQNGVLQVAMIKERLNKASVRILGDGKVNDVLLQVVQQRSM